jgi:toxin HigB-1
LEITFKDKILKKCANNLKLLKKTYGTKRAEYILQRLLDLQNVSNLEEVRNLPGHYHELKANRKGQWACNLDQPYRLIFEPHEDPIPKDDQGNYIWLEILGVEIIEIVNYHKEG